MRILQISPAQYEALADAQLDEFVGRLGAALAGEGRSSAERPDLKALVLKARTWGIEEEQDVYDLARMRVSGPRRFLEEAPALEIVEDPAIDGWLKVFQLHQLLAGGAPHA